MISDNAEHVLSHQLASQRRRSPYWIMLEAIQSLRRAGGSLREFHKDPADRIIVATARTMAAPLVTADDKIRAYPHVRSVW